MIQKFTFWNLSPRERFCREESLFSGEVPKCKFHFPLSLGKKEVLHFGIKDFSQGRKKKIYILELKTSPREGRKKFYILELKTSPREGRKKFYILELKTSPREGRKNFTFWNNFPREERSFTFWN